MTKTKEELIVENYNLRKENEAIKARMLELQLALIDKNSHTGIFETVGGVR
jgi:hypothetical protein